MLLGAGSPPFVAFLSLVSYRDVRNAWHYPVYPFLQWMHIETGEGPLVVVATCLIGVIVPAVAGFYLWHFSLNHFDRLIGRPCQGDSGSLSFSNIFVDVVETSIDASFGDGRLRRHGRHPRAERSTDRHIPIIALTAHAM